MHIYTGLQGPKHLAELIRKRVHGIEASQREGKPRTVSQQYLGSAEEIAAKLLSA
jgi:hypothetical protein